MDVQFGLGRRAQVALERHLPFGRFLYSPAAMKKGICWGCIPGDHPTRPSRAGTPEPPTLDVRLRAAKEAGFQGVEPTVSDPGAGPLTLETTEREAEGMRGTAEKMGVELPSVMCGVAVGKNPVIS